VRRASGYQILRYTFWDIEQRCCRRRNRTLYLIYLPYTYHFFFIRYAIRGDSCVSYIYDFFFLIVVSYVTPFTYSHMQHIYILHIHIYFFISIIFIRLYSNNAFKALLAQRYYQTRWCCICNDIKNIGRKRTNIAKTEEMDNFKRWDTQLIFV